MLLRVEVFKEKEDGVFTKDEIYEFEVLFTTYGDATRKTSEWLNKIVRDSEKGHKVFISVKDGSSL